MDIIRSLIDERILKIPEAGPIDADQSRYRMCRLAAVC